MADSKEERLKKRKQIIKEVLGEIADEEKKGEVRLLCMRHGCTEATARYMLSMRVKRKRERPVLTKEQEDQRVQELCISSGCSEAAARFTLRSMANL